MWMCVLIGELNGVRQQNSFIFWQKLITWVPTGKIGEFVILIIHEYDLMISPEIPLLPSRKVVQTQFNKCNENGIVTPAIYLYFIP